MKNHTSRRRPQGRERAGIALVTTLITLTTLLVLVSVFQQHTTRTAKECDASIDERRAFYLADSALSEAMTAVRAGSSGAIGSQAAPAYFGGGVLWVEATVLDPERTRLVATAMSGGGRASLEAVVRMHPAEPLFQAVLNSDEPLTLNANVMIDSFDSDLGGYAAQVVNMYGTTAYAGSNGHVASNHAIHCNAGAKTFGDATPGPGYGVTFGTGAYVAGSIQPALEPFSFDPIVVPSAVVSGPLSVPTSGTQTLAPGTYGFSNVTIGQGATLTIAGPATVVCNNFAGLKLGKLKIDATNGPVTFYVQGTYTQMQGFQSVPVTGSPLAVAFMITSANSISFPAGSKVNGAFYAPDSNFTFTSNNEVFGAIAANRIDMSSGTRFHYDESLMDYWQHAGDSATDPLELLVWHEVPVAPEELMRDRRDPFVVLDVDRSALLSPAESWIAP